MSRSERRRSDPDLEQFRNPQSGKVNKLKAAALVAVALMAWEGKTHVDQYGWAQTFRDVSQTVSSAISSFQSSRPAPESPVLSSPGQPTPETAPTNSGNFHVEGNKIIGPDGKRFVVKGVDGVYGAFFGGDKQDSIDALAHADRDLDRIKAGGFNLVRLDVSPKQVGGQTAQVEQVVKKITDRGMVAMVSQEDSSESSVATQAAFLQKMAAQYKDNPRVWFKTSNEPFAGEDNWGHWLTYQKQLIQSLRGAGYKGPIMLNGIEWSWIFKGMPDVGDKNIILGPHRYAEGHTTFDAAEQADVIEKWASKGSQYAIVGDEFGNFNPGGSDSRPQPGWRSGFVSWVADQTNKNQMQGAIFFADDWNDPNSLSTNNKWNPWGQTVIDNYVRRV